MKKKKKDKKKRTTEEIIKRDKMMLVITSILIVILLILLLVSRNYRDFSLVNVRENSKTIFSLADLSIDDIEYGATYEEVKEAFGTPKKESTTIKGNYSYKILKYDGLKVTLRENYDDYMLVKVAVTSDKYNVARDIEVGDKIIKTMKKFKVENKSGTYLYGNYSINALSEEEITDTIYFGVRNSKRVVYVNRDAIIVDNESNTAKLELKYKYGKITKITWSYDFE